MLRQIQDFAVAVARGMAVFLRGYWADMAYAGAVYCGDAVAAVA